MLTAFGVQDLLVMYFRQHVVSFGLSAVVHLLIMATRMVPLHALGESVRIVFRRI